MAKLFLLLSRSGSEGLVDQPETLVTGDSFMGQPGAWPDLLPAEWKVANRATPFADVRHVLKQQLPAVDLRSVRRVIVQVGGNPGFLSALFMTTQLGKVVAMDDAMAYLRWRIERNARQATALCRTIRERAPEATVVLVSYPHLVTARRDVGEHPGDFARLFDTGRWPLLRFGARTLSHELGKAAEEAGVGFLDLLWLFDGHELGTQESWVNEPDRDRLGQAFHPKAVGHDQIAQAAIRWFEHHEPPAASSPELETTLLGVPHPVRRRPDGLPPVVRLDDSLVRSGRWRDLPDEGVQLPDGEPVRVEIELSLGARPGETDMRVLKRYVSAYINLETFRAWTERPEVPLPTVTDEGIDVPDVAETVYGRDALTGEDLTAYGTLEVSPATRDPEAMFATRWFATQESAEAYHRLLVSMLPNLYRRLRSAHDQHMAGGILDEHPTTLGSDQVAMLQRIADGGDT